MSEKKIGRWTVLRRADVINSGYWVCRCDCGVERIVAGASLRRGLSNSCGHEKPPRLDLAGKRFGRLTALSYASRARWLCKCDCGKSVIIVGQYLREGDTKSCGCLLRERGERFKEIASSVEYGIWTAMKGRCNRESAPGFYDYGRRGIRVCDRWQESFDAFLEDMGCRPGPEFSIERINNDGNYEPGNCRWATRKEQARNKRSTVLVEWCGRLWVRTDLANHLGMKPARLRFNHLKYGNIHEAVARMTRNY